MTTRQGLGALTRSEWRLYLRDPAAAFFALVLPLVVLVVLMQVFGNTPDPGDVAFRGRGPSDFYVPGYLALAVSAVGLFGLPVRLTSYDESGVLRRFAASGMAPSTLFAAEAAVGSVVGTLGAGVMLAVAFGGYPLDGPVDVVGVAVGFVLATAMFLGVGLLLGAVLRTSRAAQSAGLVLFFLGLFLSGTGPPRELLGGGLGLVGDALPTTYAVQAMQDPWLGDGWNLPALGLCLGVAVAGTLLARRLVRWGG